jgi:hypothetical protein
MFSTKKSQILMEKVHSITLIYGRDLSFNPQPQNQVLDTCKLTKPFSLHPAVSEVVFAYVAPHHLSLLSVGPTCHPLTLLFISLFDPALLPRRHEDEAYASDIVESRSDAPADLALPRGCGGVPSRTGARATSPTIRPLTTRPRASTCRASSRSPTAYSLPRHRAARPPRRRARARPEAAGAERLYAMRSSIWITVNFHWPARR